MGGGLVCSSIVGVVSHFIRVEEKPVASVVCKEAMDALDTKRPRLTGMAPDTPPCQIAGCEEVVPSKIYYLRHRICSYHANLPTLMLDGQSVRWCQQCGRFQPLDDFDNTRKTCRVVLAQHNERRRKRNAEREDSLAQYHRSSPTVSSSNGKSGAGSPLWPAPPAATANSRVWPGAARGKAEAWEAPLSGRHGGAQQQQQQQQHKAWDEDLQAWPPAGPQAAPLLQAGRKQPGQWLVQAACLPHAAPGVLQGIPPAPAPAPASGAGRRLRAGPRAARGGWAESNSASADTRLLGVEAAASMSSAMAEELASDADLQAMLHCGPGQEGTLGGVPSEDMLAPPAQASLPPLSYAASMQQSPTMPPTTPSASLSGLEELPLPLAEGPSGQQLMGDPSNEGPAIPLHQHQQLPGPLLQHQQQQPPPLQPQQQPPPPPQQQQQQQAWPLQAGQQQQQQEGPWQLLGKVGPDQPAAPSGSGAQLVSSAQLGADGQQAVIYRRLSLKLFDVWPEELPAHVRQEVISLVTAEPVFVDSFVRPGCTHLTVAAMLSVAEGEQLGLLGAAGLAQQLLARSGWQGAAGERWSGNMLIQLDNKVAVVRQGRLAAVVKTDQVGPRLVATRPAAILAQGCGSSAGGAGTGAGGADNQSGVAGKAGVAARGVGERTVTLWGYNICGMHDTVICRQGGRVLDLEIIARGKLSAPALHTSAVAGPQPEWVVVRPLGARVGLLQFEVQRGGVLSAPASTLALPSRRAVAEAQQAQRALAGTPDGPNFAHNLGLVLGHLSPAPSGPPAHPRAISLALQLLSLARAHSWEALSELLGDALGSAGAAPSPAAAEALSEGTGPDSPGDDSGASSSSEEGEGEEEGSSERGSDASSGVSRGGLQSHECGGAGGCAPGQRQGPSRRIMGGPSGSMQLGTPFCSREVPTLRPGGSGETAGGAAGAAARGSEPSDSGSGSDSDDDSLSDWEAGTALDNPYWVFGGGGPRAGEAPEASAGEEEKGSSEDGSPRSPTEQEASRQRAAARAAAAADRGKWLFQILHQLASAPLPPGVPNVKSRLQLVVASMAAIAGAALVIRNMCGVA